MISLADQFRVGHATACNIITDTLNAICDGLSDIVLPLPLENDWLNNAEGFNNCWNFPHCIGAIDGKHIRIVVRFCLIL